MVRRSPKLFLRKHRKWPFSSYKTKWHQTFAEKQAMQSFKQLVSVAVPQLNHPSQPNLDLSSLIRSFSLYNLSPTPRAYQFLIKELIQSRQFTHIPSVLHHLESIEKFQTPEYIFADLIKTYGDANRIEDAVDVFYRIPNFRCVPSVYSLNALLAVLCRNHFGLKLVPEVLLKSLVMNIRVEESTFRILVGALCRMNRVAYAIEILQRMIDDGLGVNDKVCSLTLSSICAEGGLDGDDVMGFWRELRKLGFCPAMADYNRVISFLVKNGKGSDALGFLNEMKSYRIKPGIVSYTMVLNGVIAERDYKLADNLFDELLLLGLVPDVYTYNAYISALCKQNKNEEGIKMLTYMEKLGCKPNVVTYNTILEAFCKIGEISRARELLREMKYKGIEMNLVSYKVIIDGLVSKGEILEASGLLEEVLHKCFCHQSSTFDEVLCSMCRRGLVCEALELLRKMVDRNVSPGVRVWETLISESRPKFCMTTFNDLVNPL